uniref:Uncharacterized protein n=1 Tax=Anguilla anguilla TaxID=7936 RepID=A0A0E9RL50_ANGAN
MARTGNPV